MTIGECVERYQLSDVAHVWEVIVGELVVRNPDGDRVRLAADRAGDEGRWVVREVPA